MPITDKDRIDFLQHIMITNDIRTEIDKVINSGETKNYLKYIQLPPTSPPGRICKEPIFCGFFETKESKEATLNWYLNNGVKNNQNTINNDKTTLVYKKRNKIEQFLEKFFDAIFGV